MASIADVRKLRALIAEPDDSSYSDQALATFLEGSSGPESVAYEIWVEKAAKYAELVNISEAGSSRAMGDLHEQALTMVRHFSPYGPVLPNSPAVLSRQSRTRRIIRP